MPKWKEPSKILFVISNRSSAGSWWDVYNADGDRVCAGYQYLSELKPYISGGRIYKGIHRDTPQKLRNHFYASTLRWFRWNGEAFGKHDR